MKKTREEVRSTLYEIADGLKAIGDKYVSGEYKDTKDFVPLAKAFGSLMNYLLNPHLDPKEVIE